MSLTTSLVLILIPIVLLVLVVLAFLVVKRIVKIILWIAVLALVLSTAVSIYNDVRDFESRNTLFLYEQNGALVSAFIGTEEGNVPVPDLESLDMQNAEDLESVLKQHHKIVHIAPDAFTAADDTLIAQANSGDTEAFIMLYETERSARWYIRNIKSEHIRVEPATLAFRLAHFVPYAFVGGKP